MTVEELYAYIKDYINTDETSFVEYKVFEKEAAMRCAKIVKDMLRNID